MLQAVIAAASAIDGKLREAVVERIEHYLVQVVVRGRGGARRMSERSFMFVPPSALQCISLEKPSINKMRKEINKK